MSKATCLETFADMVQWCRPAGTRTERRWIRHFLDPLGVEYDGAGNVIKLIGDDKRVMYSSHTDTVHRSGGKQRLSMRDGILRTLNGDCLGADDTAGVWLMREMILAEKPGLYVFHRSEECGMVGSGWIAENNPAFLDGVKIAIALDRKGYGDVITNQMGDDCCSSVFASSLATLLGGAFKPSPNGVFTDTASYLRIIPECTNVSVGYNEQHSTREWQDMRFLGDLRYKLINLDPDKLIVARDPKAIPALDWTDYGARIVRGGWSSWDDYDQEPRPRSMIGLVKDHPDEIAAILEDCGYDPARLLEEISSYWTGR